MQNKRGFACNRSRHPLGCLYMITKHSHFDRNDNALANEQASQMAEINREIARTNHALAEERYLEEQALLTEVYEAEDSPVWEDHYEDIDYGYHDQYEQ